jgi:hypothetical protein
VSRNRLTGMRRLLVVIALSAIACSGGSPSPVDSGSGIAGTALAGPVCPVERPGDSACDPRPVAGALVIVRGADGSEIATAQTADDGSYEILIPPGRYTVEGAPVEGLMGNPTAVEVEVGDGVETVNLQYDTGIR